MQVNVHEAKTHFSKLLNRVSAGEEIIISKGGKPVAKLVPIVTKSDRRFGIDAGLFEVPDDFDTDLSEELLGSFES